MRTTLRVSSTILAVAMLTVGGCKSDPHDEHAGIPNDAKIDQDKVVTPTSNMHVAAGDLAVGQGHVDEAVKQYKKALEMEPASKTALYHLATIYTFDKQFDVAIETWQQYVDATNQSAGGYVNLGRANELAGNWKEAEVAYLRATNREPLNKAARVNYGILLAKRDRIDEATEQLSKALRPAEVQYDLASVYEIKENAPAAIAGYAKALELDPKFIAARQRLENLQAMATAQ